MKIKKIHVVSNSHLDREHRHAFQETRIMLVHLMDELIEIMESDSDYRFFTLDGQAIVLNDYLEVKPHMKERLTSLIRDGRILIGPWYSLVDCYSVNPESIIRNLLVGHKVCKEFGEPMKLGYSIFSFGQMAQLPQVYAGFGINDIVFYKGGSRKAFPKSEFIWKAPDGSEAFTTRLGREARWNFFFDFDIPVILGGNAKKAGWQSKFSYDARLCHMIDEKYVNTFSTELEPDIRIREDKIEESVNTVLNLLDESASENVFLGFQGTDFTAPLSEIPQALKIANELMKDKVELIHSNPVLYFDEVKNDIDLSSLINYEGEMRFGPVSHVHSETMGTNTEIKQALFNAENTLINYAEPLSTFLKINGGKYEKDILDLAWKYLMAAQAHDSIHGSGDPQIKTDNINRLEQVQEIADAITKRAVEGLASLIDMSYCSKDEMVVAVFNTTPYKRNEVINLTIDFPEEDLMQDYWLEELTGERVDCYQLSRGKFNLAMVHRKYRPKSVYSDRVKMSVNVKDIPPMGYKLLKVKWQKGENTTSTNPFPVGIFPYNPIGKSGNVLDNGLLRLTVNNNGSVNVYDYESKKTYKELNYFTDSGSSGDFWVHREPYNNNIICTKGCSAQIELVTNSGMTATMRIITKLDIPEALSQDRSSRSKHSKPVEIISEVTLNKESKRIDFKTTLYNECKDHMFVVSFPTGIKTEYGDWESPFEIRKRSVDNFTNEFGKKGPELERHAMQNFIDISDDKNGIALFTKGLRETGTTDDDGVIMNLTLFRACSNTYPIHNDLLISFEKETSQCIGEQSFEYALFIHQGDFISGNIISESRKYAIPPVSAQIGYSRGGKLKDNTSFMDLKNQSLTLCTAKLAEDKKGIVIRLNNPIDASVSEEIEFMNEIKEAYLVNMNEEIISMLDIVDNTIKLEVKPYKIITLYISFF